MGGSIALTDGKSKSSGNGGGGGGAAVSTEQIDIKLGNKQWRILPSDGSNNCLLVQSKKNGEWLTAQVFFARA